MKLTTNVNSAQNSLDKMLQVMELKLLDVHPDKTGFMVVAGKENRNKIEEDLKKNPLKYKNQILKQKSHEKWLGDTKHNNGLAASVEATINDKKR